MSAHNPIYPGWSGPLTRENMDSIAATMHDILVDKPYTYIMWYKQPVDQEWTASHDYSHHTFLTSDIHTTRKEIWIHDKNQGLHLEEGLIITFDSDEGGFTIEEPWRPERAIYRYQYRVEE